MLRRYKAVVKLKNAIIKSSQDSIFLLTNGMEVLNIEDVKLKSLALDEQGYVMGGDKIILKLKNTNVSLDSVKKFLVELFGLNFKTILVEFN